MTPRAYALNLELRKNARLWYELRVSSKDPTIFLSLLVGASGYHGLSIPPLYEMERMIIETMPIHTPAFDDTNITIDEPLWVPLYGRDISVKNPLQERYPEAAKAMWGNARHNSSEDGTAGTTLSWIDISSVLNPLLQEEIDVRSDSRTEDRSGSLLHNE